MATATEMREALRAAGVEVPERGRINADLQARYEQLAGEPGGSEDDWDLPGTIDDGEEEPSVPMQPERPPRTQRSARRERRRQPVGERLLGRRRTPEDAKAKAKARPKHKRVSVDHLIARTWEAAARFTQPLSLPLSRCLQVQSPVAGMILEEIVAGTVVDRALQPIARAEEKAEKVIALIAPPVLVVAIEQTMIPGLMSPEQAAMRQAVLIPMLRESLRIWIQVAGPKVEEAAAREAEYQEKFGKTIDEMMAMFFSAPPGTTAEQEQQPAEPEMAMAGAVQ